MSKFFPSYQLYIETQDGEMISLPEEYANDREFACKFTVTQTTTSTPQNATINIYNLSDSNRKKIFFNWFDQVSVMKRISLYAGYNEEKYLIFDGVQQEVSTYREGASLVTEIHATALGFGINGFFVNQEAIPSSNSSPFQTNLLRSNIETTETEDYIIKEDPNVIDSVDAASFSFPRGQKNREVLKFLVEQFLNNQRMYKNLSFGCEVKISNDKWLDSKLRKPTVLTGNIIDLIKDYVPPNTNVWIDRNKLYVISTKLSLCKNKNKSSSERQYLSDRYQKAKERRDKRTYMIDGNIDVSNALSITEKIENNDSSDISQTNVTDLENLVIINPDTGLLNTPRFFGQSMQLTTLFEPRVNCGDLVRLESTVQPEFNRDYKVCGVTHSCEMGFGTSGSNVTSLTLVYPNSNFMDVGYAL